LKLEYRFPLISAFVTKGTLEIKGTLVSKELGLKSQKGYFLKNILKNQHRLLSEKGKFYG
jgi:hypothetical protein